MRALAHDAAQRPRIRELARMVASTQGANESVIRLWQYLSRVFVYEPDPKSTELVRTPELLLDQIDRFGNAFADCDDLATFAAAVALAMDLEPVFIVAGRQHRFEHVFVGIVDQRGTVIPIDAQEGLRPGEWPDFIERGGVLGV